MKKIILSFLTLVAISAGVNAQIVNIPDATFKTYLVGNTAINTNGDTEIQVSEASAFTGTMNCSNLYISNLTGIEAFTALTGLYCYNNNLSSLNVSNNTTLEILECHGNLLGNINVSNNTNLTELYCDNNNLSSLDVSNNTVLTALDCSNNLLYNLNVANGNNSNFTFFSADNSTLTCIQVDDIAYSNANWTNINLASSFSTNCGAPCTVNIPDANFKAYLVGNTAINTNGDTEIQCSEASAYSGVISVGFYGISDLTGVEAFINLTELYCHSNSITSLDISINTSLVRLNCSSNLITSLDVSNGNNTNFTAFQAWGNPNLTCITVDNPSYSNTNWISFPFIVDAQTSFSTNCSGAILVSSITIQGQNGTSTITTPSGTLQMEATVLPANADDATYTWSVANGSGSASISASGLLTSVADGTVTVTATANDGSGETGSATITISNQTAGIDEVTLNNLSIYPNPVQNQLFIESSDNQITELVIFDVTGKVVKSIAHNTNSIDISDLNQGVYILKVETEKGVSTQRFVKQ